MATRILLVEDNQKVRELCERTLKNAGFEVRAFATAKAAIEADFTPDVLVSDFGLPDQTGLDLSLELQAKHQTLLVLLISGHPLEEIMHEEELPLSHGYLEKPFNGPELLEAVGMLLGRPIGSADPDSRDAGSAPIREDRTADQWKRIAGTWYEWD